MFVTVSMYAQDVTLKTIKVQGVDTAAMLLPYKRSYPRQSVSLTFTTTGTSGAATGTYSNSTGVFTINVPQYLAPTNGQFTSTAVGSTNVSSVFSSPVMFYTKINNQVHIMVSCGVTPTSTGPTQVTLTLPTATALSAGTYLGTGTMVENGGTFILPAYAYVSNSTHITVNFLATIAGASGTFIIMIDYAE